MTDDDGDFLSDNLHFHDDESPTDQAGSINDSAILGAQSVDPKLLKISRVGETFIIGFHGNNLTDDVCMASYRQQVFSLLDDPTCKKMQFDLTGVLMLPSGMLGLLASIKKRGCEVELANPSKDIRDVLHVTKMDTMFSIGEPRS